MAASKGHMSEDVEKCPFLRDHEEISEEQIDLYKRMEPFMRRVINVFVGIGEVKKDSLQNHSVIKLVYNQILRGFQCILLMPHERPSLWATCQTVIFQEFQEELGITINKSGWFDCKKKENLLEILLIVLNYSMSLLVLEQFPETQKILERGKWNLFANRSSSFPSILGHLVDKKFYDGECRMENLMFCMEVNKKLDEILNKAIDNAMDSSGDDEEDVKT